MITLNDKYKLAETIEDLNVCRFIELQVFDKLDKDIMLKLALLINPKSSDTDETQLNETIEKVRGLVDYPIKIVEEFKDKADANLRYFFPDDFSDNDFLLDNLKQLLIVKCKAHTIDGFMSAGLLKELDLLNDVIDAELREIKDHSIKDIYASFEELCFYMSQMDKTMSVKEIKQLTVYEFYTHKMNIFKLRKKEVVSNG